MKLFVNRTPEEQAIIRAAYNFEQAEITEIINSFDGPFPKPNPYYEAILKMEDGRAVWEAIDEALSLWLNS